MSSKWTLVTGANGFIGSHLVRALVGQGHKVKALVRAGANLGQLSGLPASQLRIAQGDLRIVDRVYAAMNGCDRAYHVASAVVMDERSRRQTLQTAVEGTDATLEAARRAGLEKVVVTSSIFALGSSNTPQSLDEGHAFNVVDANAYTQSKHLAETLALERAAAGQPVVVVNPGLVVGPGDYRPSGTGALFLRYLNASVAWPTPIMPGGFNFVAVDDVVSGHLLAMEKGRVGERYALGGENLTHRQFYAKLADLTGLAEPGGELGRSAALWVARLSEWQAAWGGQSALLTRRLVNDYFDRYVYVNSEKAKRELGYQPGPVGPAFLAMVRWYLEHGYVIDNARSIRLEPLPAA